MAIIDSLNKDDDACPECGSDLEGGICPDCDIDGKLDEKESPLEIPGSDDEDWVK